MRERVYIATRYKNNLFSFDLANDQFHARKKSSLKQCSGVNEWVLYEPTTSSYTQEHRLRGSARMASVSVEIGAAKPGFCVLRGDLARLSPWQRGLLDSRLARVLFNEPTPPFSSLLIVCLFSTPVPPGWFPSFFFFSFFFNTHIDPRRVYFAPRHRSSLVLLRYIIHHSAVRELSAAREGLLSHASLILVRSNAQLLLDYANECLRHFPPSCLLSSVVATRSRNVIGFGCTVAGDAFDA